MDFNQIDILNPSGPVFKDNNGYYTILKNLKEIKFGDKSTITEVKTPSLRWNVPIDVENDPERWAAFNKFYFCDFNDDPYEKAEELLISYIRVDGKPEKASLPYLLKVILFLLR